MDNSCYIIYIRQDERVYLRLFEKIVRFICKIFFIVRCESLDGEKIIIVPKKKRYTKLDIIIIKNKASIAKNGIDNYYIVLDKNLNFLKDSLDASKVLDGKLLMKNSIQQILDYIFLCNGQNMNLENIYVLVNKYTKENVYLIRNLIQNFKTVNIITDDLKHFKLLENRVFKEGILITVSNNKRKGVKNARYIVNLDFTKEDVSMYNINPNAIILNCVKEINIIEKGFNGIIVNNMEVELNSDIDEYMKEFYGNIDSKIYLESCLIKCDYYSLKTEKGYLENDGSIIGLYGIRGILSKHEIYENCRK